MPLKVTLFLERSIKSRLLAEFFGGAVMLVLPDFIALFDFVDEFKVILSESIDDLGKFAVRLGRRRRFCRKNLVQTSLHLSSHSAIEFKLTTLNTIRK
jgi:hypothetical protein